MAICEYLDSMWAECRKDKTPCEYRRERAFRNCPKQNKPARDAHGHFIKKEVEVR